MTIGQGFESLATRTKYQDGQERGGGYCKGADAKDGPRKESVGVHGNNVHKCVD